MPSSIKKLVWTGLLVLILFFSASLGAYAWWLFKIESGIRAFQRGDTATAALIINSAETPFVRLPWLTRIFRDDYQKLVFNRAAILYGESRYDEVIKKLNDDAGQTPFLNKSGEYAFWMGNALLQRSVLDKNPESSEKGLKSALAEYQRGLVACPGDWDLKYNYELLSYRLSRKGPGQIIEADEEEDIKLLLDKQQPPDDQSFGQLPPGQQG